jgi:hypothetical protein
MSDGLPAASRRIDGLDQRVVFASLEAVVIDEIHAFVGDDRGGHLSSVLERLSRFCGRDVQRIGLSATVGNPEDILRWVRGSSKRDRDELVEHMLTEGILYSANGLLSLGERGQRQYGAKHFAELYTVFSAPHTLTVMHGHEPVGQIDANFAQASDFEGLTFTLGAKTWRAKHLDWNRALLLVELIEAGGLPRWQGQPRFLPRALCQAIREVLMSDDEPDVWSTRARAQLKQIRAEYAFFNTEGITLKAETGGFRLWTFAGGRANNLLAKTLESMLGEKATSSNLSIGLRERAGESEVAIRGALEHSSARGDPITLMPSHSQSFARATD